MGTLADSMGVTSEKKRLRRSPLASFRMMAAISKSFPFTSYKKTNKQKAKITHHIRLERHQGNERKQQKNRLKNKNKRKAHLAVGIGVELEAQVEVRVGQAETVARRAEERQSRVRVVDADVVLQIAPDRLAIRQVLVAVRRPAPRPPKTPKKNKQKNKQTNSVMSRAENEPDIWPGRRVPRKTQRSVVFRLFSHGVLLPTLGSLVASIASLFESAASFLLTRPSLSANRCVSPHNTNR